MNERQDQEFRAFDQHDALATGEGSPRGGRATSSRTGEGATTSSSSVQPPIGQPIADAKRISDAKDVPTVRDREREDDGGGASAGSNQPPIQRPDPGGAPVVRRKPGAERGATR